jgi:signal transduction histidine kinase
MSAATPLALPRDDASPRTAQLVAPPGRAIVAALLLAVGSFMASTLIATSRLREVSAQSQAISTNAMPSVIALTTMRERLDELVSSLNQAVDAPTARLPDFDRTAAEIGAQSASYEAHALSPERRDRWARTRALVTAALSEATLVRDALSAGRVAEGHTRLDSDVRPVAAAAEKELFLLVELNATEGEQFAHHIEQVRRNATVLLVGLDVACVGFAVALTALALRAVARHTRLMELRSHELEQFAARVAHDVRGPLSPIALVLQRLQKESASEGPRRAMLDTAVRSLGRVTSLVEDLLAFARAGGALDRSACASVLAVARATLEEAEVLASESAIDLRLDPLAEDVIVACPAGVLTSLVSNLVHNAIKYMGEGQERRVVVRALRVGRRLRMEVEDTGPGLPPGAERDVFKPYVRADRSGQPGLGLGLATVKRFAEGYGGCVGVRSGHRGCAFWFELPVALQG